jgi:hypothetical protein
MSLNRHAKKRDLNEVGIIAMWNQMGAYVESISGPGLMDTLVHYDGHIFRAEVKGAKRGLTPKQVEHFTKAHHSGVPTYIVRTPADAAMLLETTLDPWTPEMGALAGAVRKERARRPGRDRALTNAEACGEAFCATSRLPGFDRCAAHVGDRSMP